MKLLESAKWLGGLRAVELTCFARLGERAPQLAAPACARWAASASLAHAWRASLLEDLLPVSIGLPNLDDLTVLPAGALADELARVLPSVDAHPLPLSRDSGTDDGRVLIADLSHRLYPFLLKAYNDRMELASPPADGAVVRNLARAVADLEIVRNEGATLAGGRVGAGGGAGGQSSPEVTG